MTSARLPATTGARPAHRQESTNLADILERVLDKGIVIAGDIRVNLLDIELLTVKIRLLVASVDKARELGIDWWEHDPTLTSTQRDLAEENRSLRQRIGALEAARLTDHGTGEPTDDTAEPPELETAHPHPPRRADRPGAARSAPGNERQR
ncbi:MAG: gas vesicle protein [Pseudonocardia sp.]|nr:gas vesicle protein [Pseudonocardia sp.]MBO0872025.1 gas vesicle protein [Pseudonocardia sp.]